MHQETDEICRDITLTTAASSNAENGNKRSCEEEFSNQIPRKPLLRKNLKDPVEECQFLLQKLNEEQKDLVNTEKYLMLRANFWAHYCI